MIIIESIGLTMNYSDEFPDFHREYQLYYPLLLRKAYFILQDNAKAEDIVQEALIKYYYTETKIDNPKAWLIKVTVNLCYNYLRSEKGRSIVETDILSESYNDVEENIIQSEEAFFIRKAFAKISERDRTMILLRFSGYSYKEIAQIIKIEESSVGTLLARAKKRFKEALISLKGSDFCASE